MLNKPIFDEASHTYRNPVHNYFYTSGTTLVGLFKPKFDTDYWSLYNAGRRILGISDENKTDYSKLLIKNGLDFANKTDANLRRALILTLGSKYLELDDAQTKEQGDWKANTKLATDAGTKVHKEKEDGLKNTGIDISIYGLSIPVIGVFDEIDNLALLKDGVYPELMVWNNQYRVAGISDKVTIETQGNIRYVDIDDYKTNKEIKTLSYCNKNTGEYAKMLFPVNHLMECNFIHYSLQLSLYAYLLECFGFVVRSIKFTHIPLNETRTAKLGIEQAYYVKYLRSDIIKMLNHYAVEAKIPK